MVQTGKVISVGKGKISVCFERPETCGHCGGCGGAKHHATVQIPGQAPVGSWVAVEMPQTQVLKASVLAYVLPLAALLCGVLAGSWLFDQEALWAVMGLGMMGMAWAALRLIDRRMSKRPGWQPRIIAIHEKGEQENGNQADQG